LTYSLRLRQSFWGTTWVLCKAIPQHPLSAKNYLNHSQKPWRIPMGKKIAPANKNPHKPSLKHVKM
jgi:hypothetical protein